MNKVLKSISLLALLLLIITDGKGQVPGYLGKRGSIGYRLYTIPGIQGTPNFNSPESEKNYLRTRHHLEANFVTARSASLGLSFGWCRNGIEEYSTFSNQETHITVNSFSTGLHIRLFPFLRKGNIAPIGPYTEFNIAWCHFRMQNPEGDYFADGRTDLGTLNNIYLSFSLGRNYLVKEIFLLSYGIQVGWLAPKEDYDLGYIYDVNDGMRTSYSINVHIGVEGLLF